MPILIVLVLGGLVTFFLLSRPGKTLDRITSRAPEEEPALRAVPVAEAPAPDPSNPESPAKGASRIPLHSSAGSFTPWMTPVALDTYIRQLNGPHEESFWKRGHWICAVEGRWREGGHEFRIVYEKMPGDAWAWRYRANRTRRAFLAEDLRLRTEGFRLVQEQAFLHPDGSERVQGVWRRRLEPAEVAGTHAGAAPDAGRR